MLPSRVYRLMVEEEESTFIRSYRAQNIFCALLFDSGGLRLTECCNYVTFNMNYVHLEEIVVHHSSDIHH